jgi:hypothetical protein
MAPAKANAASARWQAAPAPATYRRRKAGVSGVPDPTVRPGNAGQFLGAESALGEVDQRAVSREMTHGVTVP